MIDVNVELVVQQMKTDSKFASQDSLTSFECKKRKFCLRIKNLRKIMALKRQKLGFVFCLGTVAFDLVGAW